MRASRSGKPSRPEGPLKVEDVRETRALCKWNKPKDDGGTELKGYVVEKMDVDTGRWVPAGEVSSLGSVSSCAGLGYRGGYGKLLNSRPLE